ncbi:hypothetical protein [Nocardia sp. NPDC051570]|uniref:hypothetical protein n=1 Tax=Nocardia sp. NPDC051570 TaxID=3364324 RepID=UPI0037BDA2B5
MVEPLDNNRSDRDPEATEVLSLAGKERAGRMPSLRRLWSRVRVQVASGEVRRYLPHAAATAVVITAVIAVVIAESGRSDRAGNVLAASDSYETQSGADRSAEIEQLRASDVVSGTDTPRDVAVPDDAGTGDSGAGEPVTTIEVGTDEPAPTIGDGTTDPAPAPAADASSTHSTAADTPTSRPSVSVSVSATASASVSAQVTAKPGVNPIQDPATTTVTVVAPPPTTTTASSMMSRPTKPTTPTTPAPPASTPPQCAPATTAKKSATPSSPESTIAHPPTKTAQPSTTTAKPSTTQPRPCR